MGHDTVSGYVEVNLFTLARFCWESNKNHNALSFFDLSFVSWIYYVDIYCHSGQIENYGQYFPG